MQMEMEEGKPDRTAEGLQGGERMRLFRRKQRVFTVVDTQRDQRALATKTSMDDALDFIEKMEGFDKAEGMFKQDRYLVRMEVR